MKCLKVQIVCVTCIGLILVAGCDSPVATPAASPDSGPQSGTAQTTQSELTGEPEFITVQHILIGFSKPNEGRPGATSSVPGKNISRTKEEAAKLANELLKRGTDGEDFGELVKEFTDDSAPGIYQMANFGVTDVPKGVYLRGQMVPAFGNVGFPLPVGGVGLATYSAEESPYGWHVIKRTK